MVEVKVHSARKNEIEFELIGEGHAFAKLLMNKLLGSKEVEDAGYDIKHPLLANPYFVVKVKSGDPAKVVISALNSLQREL